MLRSLYFPIGLFALILFPNSTLACPTPGGCVTEVPPNRVTTPPTIITQIPRIVSMIKEPAVATIGEIANGGLSGIAGGDGSAPAPAGEASPGTNDGQSAATGEGGDITASNVAESTVAQTIISNLDLKAAGWNGRGGAIVADNPQQVAVVMSMGAKIMVAIEQQLILPKLNMNGGSASLEPPAWNGLGILMAAAPQASVTDAEAVMAKVSKLKMTWQTMDRNASEFTLATWLACYALLAPEGGKFLPWAVGRAIHKSNVFYEGMLSELEHALADRNLPQRKERLVILEKAISNPDLLLVRDWLAKLGTMVVIEK